MFAQVNCLQRTAISFLTFIGKNCQKAQRRRALRVTTRGSERSEVKWLTPTTGVKLHRKNAALKVTIQCKQVCKGAAHTYTHTHRWPLPDPGHLQPPCTRNVPSSNYHSHQNPTHMRVCVCVCTCLHACRYCRKRVCTYRSGWPSKLIKPDTLIKSWPISPRYEDKSQSILHILLPSNLELSSGTFGQCSAPETQARLKKKKKKKIKCKNAQGFCVYMCVVCVCIRNIHISYIFLSLSAHNSEPAKISD